jgi:hypothetical protein
VRLLLRAAAAVVVASGVVLALSAFGPGHLGLAGPAAPPDQRFVAEVREQGRTVESGETEVLVVSAAHKLCERREDAVSSAQRRASALTADEIEAVRRTFGDDAQAFMQVALRTYCP